MMSTRRPASALATLLLAACSADEQGLRVVGQLASDRIELSAEVGEPIVHFAVDEGTPVAAGDVLARQDTRRAEARLAESTAAVAEARARLDELLRGPRGEQIAAARASFEGATNERAFRRAEFERIRDVHARNLASAEALDAARAALDAADANLGMRRAQLEELLAGTTVETLAQAEAALDRAAALRERAAIDLERHTLYAPVDGIADTRVFEIGERPQPGQPVIVLLAGSHPHARVYIPERLRAGVRAGTPARIFVDGIAEPFDGRVRWVASDAAFTPYFALTERDRGRLSYHAKIDIDFDGTRLPDGVPVEVELEPGTTDR